MTRVKNKHNSVSVFKNIGSRELCSFTERAKEASYLFSPQLRQDLFSWRGISISEGTWLQDILFSGIASSLVVTIKFSHEHTLDSVPKITCQGSQHLLPPHPVSKRKGFFSFVGIQRENKEKASPTHVWKVSILTKDTVTESFMLTRVSDNSAFSSHRRTSITKFSNLD